MPRKKTMGRAANGNGTIRKKTVTKNGTEYTIGKPAVRWAMTPAPESSFKNPLLARHKRKPPKN